MVSAAQMLALDARIVPHDQSVPEEDLLRIAHERLIQICGHIVPENQSMLRIVKKVGFTVTFNCAETVSELKLW